MGKSSVGRLIGTAVRSRVQKPKGTGERSFKKAARNLIFLASGFEKKVAWCPLCREWFTSVELRNAHKMQVH